MTFRDACDLGVRIPLLAQRCERISLSGSDLVIAHDDPFLAEDSSVSQIAPFFVDALLHLLLEFATSN